MQAAMSGSRNPRVTVGLPVYNGARFVEGALRSILSQTVTDLELIVSDNASTDDTREICERYASKDARIRYFRQSRNIGAPRNWNFVFEQARGTYFKWNSANDECSPETLERCAAALDADPTLVLVQGRTCLVDEDTGSGEPYAEDMALMQEQALERVLVVCRQLPLRLNNGQAGGVIRASALKRTRLDRPFENGDILLMAELAMLGKFLVLPEVLLYRRMGSTTFSSTFSAEARKELYERSVLGHRVPWHLDFFRTMALAPLPIADKAQLVEHGLGRFKADCPRFMRSLRARLLSP
jgi:glycosyltransferase involved in cell wall biosynthesis